MTGRRRRRRMSPNHSSAACTASCSGSCIDGGTKPPADRDQLGWSLLEPVYRFGWEPAWSAFRLVDALDRAGHPAMEGAHELGGALGDGEGGGGDRTCLDRAGVEVGGLDREIVSGIVGVGDLDGDLFTRRQFQGRRGEAVAVGGLDLGRVPRGRAGVHVADGIGAVAARGQRHPQRGHRDHPCKDRAAHAHLPIRSVWRRVVPACCATIGSSSLVLVPPDVGGWCGQPASAGGGVLWLTPRAYGHPRAVDRCAGCGSAEHHSRRMRATGGCGQNLLEVGMQTPRMLSTVHKAAPALTDAGVGVGVAVLLLAASAAGTGPPWIISPRPLDAVAVGLIGVVAGALALRRRYPISVLVVLNAVALAWAAAPYPGRLITLA